MPQTNEQLIQLLKERGVLKSKNVAQAMAACPRKYFVPQEYQDEAYGNYPLPLGEGQTISQPLTVIFMLELLEVKPGHKVLEIGYGSGWQTALLSYLVGRKGHVYAFEIKKKIAQFGKQNLTNPVFTFRYMNTKNYKLFQESFEPKFTKWAAFDRIISGAAFKKIPPGLVEALAPNGRLVAPTQNNDIRVVLRDKKGKVREKIIPGFVFVPIT